MTIVNEHSNRVISPELLAEEQLAILCSRNFQIARWLVEPKTNQLRYLGVQAAQPKSLEPRIMFLLCVLAANTGNVVSRNDLMTTLWPRVVVNENSLTRAISELRKALEAPVNEPERAGLIDTIPKKGYRLNTAVTVPPAVSATQSVSGTYATTGAAHSIGHQARFAAAASLAFIAALLIWQLPSVLNSQPEIIVVSPPSSGSVSQVYGIAADAQLTGNEYISQTVRPSQSVMSRNGELFAYINYNDAGSSLILGSMNSFSSPVNIYETEELIFNLQWSPVDNILLFAQAPRLSPAALSPEKEVVKLLMFDISTMAATVLSGDGADPVPLEPFSLT